MEGKASTESMTMNRSEIDLAGGQFQVREIDSKIRFRVLAKTVLPCGHVMFPSIRVSSHQ